MKASLPLWSGLHARRASRGLRLIRQLIDRSIGGSGAADLDADLAAIRDSFGIARDEDVSFGRGSDERSRHLDRMAEL